MIKILDNEGEVVIVLTDVANKADLKSRLDSEDQSKMDILYDTPFFADVIGESDYGNNSEEEFEECESHTLTYREWIDDCLAWASRALDELAE